MVSMIGSSALRRSRDHRQSSSACIATWMPSWAPAKQSTNRRSHDHTGGSSAGASLRHEDRVTEPQRLPALSILVIGHGHAGLPAMVSHSKRSGGDGRLNQREK